MAVMILLPKGHNDSWTIHLTLEMNGKTDLQGLAGMAQGGCLGT